MDALRVTTSPRVGSALVALPWSIAARLLRDTVATAYAARVVLLAAADAVQSGLVADVTTAARDMARAVEALDQVVERLDRLMAAVESAPAAGRPNRRVPQPGPREVEALEDALF